MKISHERFPQASKFIEASNLLFQAKYLFFFYTVLYGILCAAWDLFNAYGKVYVQLFIEHFQMFFFNCKL